jgi:hypothetical protein
MRQQVQIAVVVMALLGLLAPSVAQVTVGDNTSMNLAGDVSFGYNGSFGETIASGHGIGVGGQAQLTGSYYNPNFLSFRMEPYYNRSQSNSSVQSIFNTSGFLGQVDLFRGSSFPGTISYGKSLDGSGQFGVPGLSGITTHGGGQNFGVTWSEILPDWPSVTAGFSSNSDHSEIYGTSGESRSTSRVFSLQSFYTIDGFHLNGNFRHQMQTGDFPAIVTGAQPAATDYTSDLESLQATHKIFMQGQWWGVVTHSSFGGDSHSGQQNSSNNGTSNLYSSGVTVNPTSKLSLSFNSDYYTDVFATLEQQIVESGGIPYQNSQNTSASALTLNSFAYYTLTSHIAVSGNWGRETLFLPEGERSIDRFGGTLNFNYAQPFLGSFYFSVGAVDMASEDGNRGAGLTGTVNYSKRINGWEVGAGFNYSQYVQTLLGTYTTSNYKYDASLRRRFGDGLYWTGSFFANKTGLTQFHGTTNHSEGFNTSFLIKRYSVNATLTQSSGASILTSHGLVQIPTGVPSDLVVDTFQYGSKGFGFGGTATLRRWVLTANYSKSYGNTFGTTQLSSFDTRSVNARLQYRVRKMYFNAAFIRLHQTFGALGTQPIDYNTYYVGFSRWFNVF